MPPSSRSRRSLPPAASGTTGGLRHALLETFAGRAIIVGVAVKLLIAVIRAAAGSIPAFLSVVDTVAGLAITVGAVVYLVRLLVVAKRRLLWRVRRKLILSYIFIGLVPALLIVAFFLLCGLLLFYNFSSYLVQTRLHRLEDRAMALAQSTAIEIQRGGGRDVAATLERRQTAAAPDMPGVSLAVVPVDRACADTSASISSAPVAGLARPVTAGPWSDVEPPATLPPWIDCSGFRGLLAYTHATGMAHDATQPGPAMVINGRRVATSTTGEDTHMVVRAAAFADSPRPGYAVIVDAPINETIKQLLRTETGVDVKNVTPIRTEGGATPMQGRAGGDTATQPSAPTTGPFSWVSFVDYRDWATGKAGTLVVSTQLSISEIYDRIAATPGQIGNRSFGQAILLVLLVVVGGLFLIIEFVALIVGLALAKSITGSVHALFTGTERVRQGDFTHKIEVKARDQLGELAESFNQMTASIEDLLLQAAEKKRLEEELRIAREIQMSLLPQGQLAMPGLSVTALCVPAREVGGDYYDFITLDERRLGVIIADVSGKGTSAALYMAELKGLILSLSRIHRSPRELLIRANRLVADNLDARSFITMTYAVLDLEARTMTYARAGHTPLIHLAGGNGAAPTAQILAPDGMVLGLKLDSGEMFERLLEESTIDLRANDVFLLFTDGITEAMNEADDCFGEARLGRLIEEHAHLPSEELRERVLREIAAFVGPAPQHDDMTMILIKVEDIGTVVPGQEAEHTQFVAK